MKPQTRRAARPAPIPQPSHRDLGESRTGRWILVIDRALDGGAATVHAVRPEFARVDRIPEFEDHRPVLSTIVHPGAFAARDLGLDEAGRPHFLFGAIEGRPIEELCDEQGLDWRARVELVAGACDAVQAAHDRGAIHHGLEAATVFVSGAPGQHRVHVAGFGIAATLFGDGEPTHAVDLSIDGNWVEFLAPEQTGPSDLGLDSRADVYALGVLAYRLLTGTAPHDAKTIRRSARMGMLDWMYRDGPLRASDRFRLRGDRGDEIASASGITRGELEHVLRDRLDDVLAAALERDPSQRTLCPAHFARELRRTATPTHPLRQRTSASLATWWDGLRRHVALRAT